MPRPRADLGRGNTVSQAYHHAAARLRPRRIPLLFVPSTGSHQGAAGGVLSTAGRDRQCLAPDVGSARCVSTNIVEVSRPVPRGGSKAADAVDAALRAGRLQLPAPGSLRRVGVSVAGGDFTQRSRSRLYRRRITTGGTTSSRAIPRGDRASGSG